jgi:hypothetical protein
MGSGFQGIMFYKYYFGGFVYQMNNVPLEYCSLCHIGLASGNLWACSDWEFPRDSFLVLGYKVYFLGLTCVCGGADWSLYLCEL